MSSIALATKYRPKTWEDLTEQEYIKTILENQITTNTIKNAYLFTGPAGCGKTTSARIFANRINDNQGNPIEVDGASNNGVDQIRTIIDDAKFKPLDSKYKIYIIDECHALSNGAWQAMLKLLEEPPKTTIFLLCTTDPQKIPNTILSRVQRFDFNKISFEGIVKRLKYICDKEDELLDKETKIVIEMEALEYIAKVAEGGMRTAISLLDKSLSFTHDLTIDAVVKALGISDYNRLDNLLYNLLQGNEKSAIEIIEDVYRDGKDLKLFIKQEIQFTLDVNKYILYNSYDYIQIPNTINLEKYLKAINEYDKLLDILDLLIKISNEIKYDQNPKVLIESNIFLFSRKN